MATHSWQLPTVTMNCTTSLTGRKKFSVKFMQWVRRQFSFDTLFKWLIDFRLALRYSTVQDNDYKEDVLRLMNSLVNILAIIKHFQNKIKEWLVSQRLSTPTEEQILEVVRKNYDLTLKLQDSLDQYERYAEHPKHTAFFTNLMRDVVMDTRRSIHYSIKEVRFNSQDYIATVQ